MKKIALSKESIRKLTTEQLYLAQGGKVLPCNPFQTACYSPVTWIPGHTHKDC